MARRQGCVSGGAVRLTGAEKNRLTAVTTRRDVYYSVYKKTCKNTERQTYFYSGHLPSYAAYCIAGHL